MSLTRSGEVPSVVQLAAEVIDLYERNRKLEAEVRELRQFRLEVRVAQSRNAAVEAHMAEQFARAAA